jgi:hypothetical protein
LSGQPQDTHSFIAFVGVSLSDVAELVSTLAIVLGWIGFIRAKWKKQKRNRKNRDNDLNAIGEIRHELGALAALSKNLEWKSKGNEKISPQDAKEFNEHVRKADNLLKRLGLTIEDPPFQFEDVSDVTLEKVAHNEAAQIFASMMFNRISRESFRLAAEL